MLLITPSISIQFCCCLSLSSHMDNFIIAIETQHQTFHKLSVLQSNKRDDVSIKLELEQRIATQMTKQKAKNKQIDKCTQRILCIDKSICPACRSAFYTAFKSVSIQKGSLQLLSIKYNRNKISTHRNGIFPSNFFPLNSPQRALDVPFSRCKNVQFDDKISLERTLYFMTFFIFIFIFARFILFLK